MRLKKFKDDFINESEEIHEGVEYYIKNGYITDPSIASKEVLLKKIEDEIQPAWDAFVTEHKIPMTNPKITLTSGRSTDSMYIEMSTDEVPADQLGIFANVLSSCKFMFSGSQISFSVNQDEFYFKPYVWSNLNISYSAKSGGSNGMNYVFADDSSDTWYDILEGKFRTRGEQQKVRNQES